jgi:nucleoid-associated protein YgaU
VANNIFSDLIEFLNKPVLGGDRKDEDRPKEGEDRGMLGGLLDAANTSLPSMLDDAAEALNKPLIGGKKDKKKAKKKAKAEAKAKAKAAAKQAKKGKRPSGAADAATSERSGGGRGFVGKVADALNTPVQETMADVAGALNKPVLGGKKDEPGIVGRAADALNRGPGSRSKSATRRASRIRRPQDLQQASPDVQSEIRRRARLLKSAERQAEAKGNPQQAQGFKSERVSLDGLRRRFENEMAQQAQLHAETEQMTYTVRPGDTLSDIAKRLYGKSRRWTRIYRANQDRIDDPNLIFPGQVLIIPDGTGDQD